MNERKELAGQVAIVTGGSGAIGGAILCALEQAGARAVSLDVKAPTEACRPWVECDVRDDTSVARAVEKVAKEHGRID